MIKPAATPTSASISPADRRIAVPLPGEKPTLSISDKFNAMTLGRELSTPAVRFREAATRQTSTVTFGPNGPRGPEGQPLVTVRRGKDTLYVDPNTNQYYVAQPTLRDRLTGQCTCKGPMPLPEGAQFSNSHFSDADCRELTRWAGRNLIGPGFPLPVPPGRDVFL